MRGAALFFARFAHHRRPHELRPVAAYYAIQFEVDRISCPESPVRPCAVQLPGPFTSHHDCLEWWLSTAHRLSCHDRRCELTFTGAVPDRAEAGSDHRFHHTGRFLQIFDLGLGLD